MSQTQILTKLERLATEFENLIMNDSTNENLIMYNFQVEAHKFDEKVFLNLSSSQLISIENNQLGSNIETFFKANYIGKTPNFSFLCNQLTDLFIQTDFKIHSISRLFHKEDFDTFYLDELFSFFALYIFNINNDYFFLSAHMYD